MEINPLSEYTEELQLGYLKPEQFFAVAQQAVVALGWQVASVFEQVIMCHTQGGDGSLGESITITVGETGAWFHSKSANEYYWKEGQNQKNAELFKQAIVDTIEKNREIEKKLKFFSKEKFGALLPSKTYMVTPILIYINILIFLLMVVMGVSVINPDTDSLLSWGGNFRPSTTKGEWWRLFTCMFLHGGILHLAMNVYALLYIGMFLEPLLGKFRFTATYLLTGICSSLMSISIHAYTVGVGASGAIFGMYGIFLALLTTNYIEKTARNTMLKSILFFVVYNLIYGMQGNIDNAAHIGGLVSGFIIGYIYYPGIKNGRALKHQAAMSSMITVAVVLLSAIALRFLPDDIAAYEQKMKKFADIESMALEVFKMDANAPKEEILYNIQDRGIYYWNEDIKILQEIDGLSLPQPIKDKNAAIIYYCRQRIKMYELLYKKVAEGSNVYDDKIKSYTKEIDQIVGQLKNM
jgi:rhomboid protease GluP